MSSGFVYITGCDSGFGRIAVDLFDKRGINVFAGVFLESSLAKLTSDFPSGRVVPLLLNVTDEASVLDASQFITAHLAKVNSSLLGVVNNAGILVQPCPAEWQSMKDFRDMFEVNVIGTAGVTQSVLPLLRESQGRIVCVASVAGRLGLPTEAAYCASKFAIEGYADVLRRDMLAWGVSVHIVEPGIFPNTGLYERFEKGLDVVWARLDPKLQADYGHDYYQFVRRSLSAALVNLGTQDSSLVSKAYVDAILGDTPMYRYRVGNDSKFLITGLEKLHESTVDGLLSVSDPRNPTVRPAKAPENGRALALGRMDKGWRRFLVLVLLASYALYKLRKH